jgi:hypothetical protein
MKKHNKKLDPKTLKKIKGGTGYSDRELAEKKVMSNTWMEVEERHQMLMDKLHEMMDQNRKRAGE